MGETDISRGYTSTDPAVVLRNGVSLVLVSVEHLSSKLECSHRQQGLWLSSDENTESCQLGGRRAGAFGISKDDARSRIETGREMDQQVRRQEIYRKIRVAMRCKAVRA